MITIIQPGDIAELAALAGITLTTRQAVLAGHGMSQGPDGGWAALRVRVQAGDSRVATIRELAGLFMLDERVLHVCPVYIQARESFRSLLQCIDRAPELSRRISRLSQAAGAELIRTYRGGEIRFPAGSGRGCSADLAVLDSPGPGTEAAVLPCLAAGKNPQVWLMEGS